MKILAHAYVSTFLDEDAPPSVQHVVNRLVEWLHAQDLEPGDEIVIVRDA